MKAIEFLPQNFALVDTIFKLKLSPTDSDAVVTFINSARQNNREFRVRLLYLDKKRTTGKWSQNAHINGHIQDITAATGCAFGGVKERMKELALDRGYPYDTLPDGTVMPKSESDINTVEAGYLIDTIHQFADEYQIVLTESEHE